MRVIARGIQPSHARAPQLGADTRYDSLRIPAPLLYGGSGSMFDWQLIPLAMRSRIVLSGGLNPLNVAGAVEKIRPWAVDVSSGVETAEKGIKDHRKIAQFIEAVKNADAG